jgi:hypothetical protein
LTGCDECLLPPRVMALYESCTYIHNFDMFFRNFKASVSAIKTAYFYFTGYERNDYKNSSFKHFTG